MATGGVRAGAGRKPGVPNKRTAKMMERVAADGIMPLDYMLQILRDETAEAESRMWAAEKAAPYLHPKLSNVQLAAEDDGDAKRRPKVVLTFT